MRVAFWLSAALLGWSYALFPALVLVRGRLRPRPYAQGDDSPCVTIVIAAHNEAGVIGAKVRNLLDLDYPSDRREIVIASDGSTDGTQAIVARFAAEGVRLLSLPRGGKAAALEAAVAGSAGEILVFTDANSVFAPGALRALVRPFADPSIGGVAGNQVYSDGPDDPTSTGERGYWDLDRRMKSAESAAGNVIAATGAIYAIRREHFRPIPDGVNDDFYESLSVIASGARLVFAPDAVAWEPTMASREAEYRRKVRVLMRGLRCAVSTPALFDPRRHGFYSLQLLSHKVLMRTMAAPLVVLAVSAPALWRRGLVYRIATVGQAVSYGLAAIGTLAADRPFARRKPFAIPAYFCLVQAASLEATVRVLRGARVDRWTPERTEAAAGPAEDTEGAAVGGPARSSRNAAS
jgi:cellulose synthase/poly-beta-1,6-N-acetylglucosamine synthase-like glycosyltransferase